MDPPPRQAPAPPPAAAGGAAAIPLSLRLCWWGLLGCAGVMVAAVLGLAELLGPRLLVAGLPGPLFFGGMLLFVAWWHTRGPGRRLWSTPDSFGRRWWSSPSSRRPDAGAEAIDTREKP
jgi:hypothetical protein